MPGPLAVAQRNGPVRLHYGFPARDAHRAVRNHWAIDNALHHVRDVVLAEDATHIRKAPGVFAQLRTCALNALRQVGHHDIRAARQIPSWSERELLILLQRMQQ